MKILIIRLSALGDVIHALPLAKNARLSGATVGWLTERAYGGLLEGNPSIDRLFLAQTRRWRRNLASPAHLREIAALRRGLREFAADVTIDAQGLWKSALLARLAGAPIVGLGRGNRREKTSSLLVDRPVGLPREALHVVEENLALLTSLGVPVSSAAPDARYLLDSPSAGADEFLEAVPTPFAIYHPGSRRPEKAWGEERFAALARRLHSEARLFPVISWGPGDEARARRLAALLPEAMQPPLLDLRGLSRVVSAASLFVAGDTGPLHLADALGVPALALFGPAARRRNVPARNRPFGGLGLSYDATSGIEPVVAGAFEILRGGPRRK